MATTYTDGRVVNACLANGRGEGAELVAARGASLDLEGAAGVGRLDVVRFLLERGIDVTERHRGETSLHVAAFGGHVETVSLLIQRGAPVGAEDETWGTTPLGWAVYAWSMLPPGASPDRYHEVVGLLVGAGAPVRPEWLDDDAITRDPSMLAALEGRRPR